MVRKLPAAVLMGALLSATPALAQSPGSVQRGKDYARAACTECHKVEPGVPTPPMSPAPSFADIARTPGMGPMALNAWFVTIHPNMPNLIIPERRREDLLAYFAALREAAKKAGVEAEADH